MLAQQRRALIIEELERGGAVRVADLAERLGVSDMTVRRDLDQLVRQGLVQKVHGGAIAPGGAAGFEPGFTAKSDASVPAKAAIAERAAGLVSSGAVVGLGAGTTVHALAAHLAEVPDLTVVTNSLPAADILHRPGGPTVILTGGTRTPSDALVGPVADLAIAGLHVDVLFLGCHGVTAETGLTSPNLAEAQTNTAFVTAARRVVVLADHTKWGMVGLATFAPLSRVDVFVTDAALPEPARIALSEQVGELVITD
ncbi:DeoR/GlpR transcriptional regulator [Actinomadura barringtoniae]|uniref:DeoR/GlpR transcriptional regulator n=1 Tax=Actinomadura barringtoniae TaxID=1427535 RepID=A0A939T1H4_9ACTN|nr:DeoR/GlpR transcriptional regulator [Actinomadura barringtoniae]